MTAKLEVIGTVRETNVIYHMLIATSESSLPDIQHSASSRGGMHGTSDMPSYRPLLSKGLVLTAKLVVIGAVGETHVMYLKHLVVKSAM